MSNLNARETWEANDKHVLLNLVVAVPTDVPHEETLIDATMLGRELVVMVNEGRAYNDGGRARPIQFVSAEWADA